MASTIKVTNIDTPDGSGNITVDRPLSGSGASLTAMNASELGSGTLPMARLSGTLPALNGSALTNLPSTPIRNYIIDGDFTQWPEGTSFASSTTYGPALWQVSNASAQAVLTVTRDTDVPTVAQSNHQSKYSVKYDVTTADSSIGAAERVSALYAITGSDITCLFGQQCTIAFWVKSTKTGTFTIGLLNASGNRSMPLEYTISSSNTWEYKTITFTMDNTGTWGLTEADVGMYIHIFLASGSNYDGTNQTWSATDNYSTSNQVNAVDSTSNNFFLSQVGLYLGSSAPDFTSPPIATVKKQVAWYFQNEGESDLTWKWAGIGGVTTTSTMSCKVQYAGGAMRAIPTITSSAAGTWYASDHNTGGTATAISFSGTAKDRTLISISYGSSGWGIGNVGYFMRNNATTTYLYLDARH